MKLTSMKVDRATKAPEPCCSVAAERPAYPWGLEVTLDNESLDKLKLDPLPEAGETLMLLAKVRVSRVSSNDTADGEKSRSVGLQITDLALEDAGEHKDAAKMLYEG